MKHVTPLMKVDTALKELTSPRSWVCFWGRRRVCLGGGLLCAPLPPPPPVRAPRPGTRNSGLDVSGFQIWPVLVWISGFEFWLRSSNPWTQNEKLEPRNPRGETQTWHPNGESKQGKVPRARRCLRRRRCEPRTPI